MLIELKSWYLDTTLL